MPSHTYYIELYGGYLDSDIANIRKLAIESMWEDRKITSVTVFTSATKNREVGKVIYTGSYPIFIWKPKKGSSIPLRKNGTLKR